MSSARTAEIVPRPLAVAVAAPGRALALTVLAGAGVALQSYLNGRMGTHLGSPYLASAVNNAVGFAALALLFALTGEARRVAGRLRAGARPRAWHLIGGLLGSLLVFTSAKVAPEVGVALLTVGLVCGQTTGALPVDAAGLSPAGRRPPDAARVLGAGLAVLAVIVGALGAGGSLKVGLLLLAVLAGAAGALQQATNGQLARVLESPLAAAVLNFATGFAALALVAAAVTGGHAPHGWSAPVAEWVGGLLGAFFVLGTAAAVRSLGVLRVMLAAVAGQSAGSLAIDLVAPVPGEQVTVATVAGVVLTVLAVAVSGRGKRAP